MTLRVLSVTKSTGGLARYNRRLCRRLRDAGHRVDVVCLSDGAESYADRMASLGFETTAMPMTRYKLNPASDVRLAHRLLTHVRRGSYDAVVGHGSKAGFLVRFAGRMSDVPAVYRLASMSFVRRTQGRRAPAYRQLERVGARLGGHIVTVCDAVRRELIERRIARPEGVTTIHTGIDPPELGSAGDPRQARRALGLDPDRPLIGWAARFVAQKAPLDFLSAMAEVIRRIPQAQVFMAGDGPLREEVLTKIERLGLRDHVVLAPWQEDVAQFLSALDVYVLSSRWEGLPQSLLEAMAAGRACVATAVDGSSEIMRDGHEGFLVPAGDERLMARRVIALLSDPSRRMRMGRSAAERVRRDFTAVRMTDDWLNLLDEVVGRARGDRG